LTNKSNPEPVVRGEGYDDGEDIENETSMKKSFEMRSKRPCFMHVTRGQQDNVEW